MATYSKELLSGSTQGKPIKVVATALASSPTTIHTGVAGTSDIDLVDLDACNTTTVSVQLRIGWGGVTDPDNVVEYFIPAESTVELCRDWPIQNSLVIAAAASVANVVNVQGSVKRIDK